MQTTYRDLCSLLAGIYDNGEARAIVRLVLETKFDMSYTDILCDGIQQLSDADAKRLMDIMQQLAEGMPVQYVLGEAEFCDRMYKVKPGVLIPRPETAELAIAVSEEMKDKQQAAILDICTGSGCIATTIALECPKAVVEAWDISPTALEVAKENAAKLGAKVNVISLIMASDGQLSFLIHLTSWIANAKICRHMCSTMSLHWHSLCQIPTLCVSILP